MNDSVFCGQDAESRLRKPSSRVREGGHSLRGYTMESQVGHAWKSEPPQSISEAQSTGLPQDGGIVIGPQPVATTFRFS